MREPLLAVFAAVLGAIVGSFLNACIHRMPRGISIGNPRRSFCPACQKTIPWYENLPVVSWLLLRGQCSGCGARISPRYVLVELLTALVFWGLWVTHGFPLAPVYWVLLSLLIAATFIDIEHFIIPDEITLGGTAAGIVLACLVPAMMHADEWWRGGLLSLAGAALGFGLLWLVVEGGKLAFGRKTHKYREPVEFEWKRDGDRADLRIGDESLRWEDIFSRPSDRMFLDCTEAAIDGTAVRPGRLSFHYDRVAGDSSTHELDRIDIISGRLTAIIIPREAMGFGDVKFLGMIGAFLGWQAVLFTVFASSIIGCAAGLAGIFMARDKSGSRIPFGPFLALGAAWWVFGGDRIFDWYFLIFSRGAHTF